MKSSTLIFCLSLICLAMLHISSGYGKGASSPSAQSNAAAAQLRLDLSLVAQDYCSNDQLCLTLRLTFANAGEQPVILDKNSSVISRHMVICSLAAANAKKYVENVSPFLDMMSILRLNERPDESLFVTLSPGQAYSLEEKFELFVYDGTKDSEDFLHSGDYFLEIVVLTWYYPQALKMMSAKSGTIRASCGLIR